MKMYEFLEPFSSSAVLNGAPLVSFTHTDVIDTTCILLQQANSEYDNTPFTMDASFCKRFWLFFWVLIGKQHLNISDRD